MSNNYLISYSNLYYIFLMNIICIFYHNDKEIILTHTSTHIHTDTQTKVLRRSKGGEEVFFDNFFELLFFLLFLCLFVEVHTETKGITACINLGGLVLSLLFIIFFQYHYSQKFK